MCLCVPQVSSVSDHVVLWFLLSPASVPDAQTQLTKLTILEQLALQKEKIKGQPRETSDKERLS